MKRKAGVLDTTPYKRIVLSIVSDYDLTKSICELVDNALDLWTKGNKTKKLVISIDFDLTQKTICIQDNAGGIQEGELEFLVSPGATTNKMDDSTIGIFGVGTKRAVIALSEDVKITSRYKKKQTFAIEFDKHWLNEETWNLDYFTVDQIPEGSTKIELQKLRFEIDDEIIKNLSDSLSSIYAHFLQDKSMEMRVGKVKLDPQLYENWAFPPSYEPRRFKGKFLSKNGREVEVEVLAGLTKESSPVTGDYGVCFYCNDRLVVSNLKTPEVGFIRGIAGQPHPSISIIRILVSLKGAAEDMPWNSSKSGINTNHPSFDALRNWLLDIVKNITSLSRRLDWNTEVFKYDEGKIVDMEVTTFEPKKQYLIDLPPTNKRYVDVVKNKNARVQKVKPWTIGIVEGVVAVDYISRQKLVTKNRIGLTILDSTLEISFKEYLVNDCGTYYSDTDLLKIFAKRHLVIQEIKKYITDISDDDWKKVKHYNDLRNKLIHERATVDINDHQLSDFRLLVERITKKLFNLKF